MYHHSHVGAHIGVNALVRRVRERFYWVACRKMLNSSLINVLFVGRRNYPKPQATGNLLSRDVLSLIAIDMVGPVDHNQESFRILTVICHASRYAAAIVMPAKCTGEAVWSSLMTHWFSVWSFPTALLSDNGTSFCNKFIDDCCQELGYDTIALRRITLKGMVSLNHSINFSRNPCRRLSRLIQHFRFKMLLTLS